MLDQNTDRMWYVIGAVIIGAAIVLILNGTMPQIFASVAESFEAKTEKTTTVTDGIGPKVRPPEYVGGDNMLAKPGAIFAFGSTVEYPTGDPLEQITLSILNGDRKDHAGGLRMQQKYLQLKDNTEYVLTYDYQKVEGKLVSFGGHVDEGFGRYNNSPVYVDGLLHSPDSYIDSSAYTGDNMDRHTVEIHIITGDTANQYFGIWVQPNRGTHVNVKVDIYNLALREKL